MVIAWAYNVGPDEDFMVQFAEPAHKEFHSCKDFAMNSKYAITTSVWVHIYCFIALTAAEVFSSDVGTLGAFIRAGDVISMATNVMIAILSYSIFFRYLGFRKIAMTDVEMAKGMDSEYRCYLPEYNEGWLGSAIAWFAIELMIYFVFLMTMMILLFKFMLGKNIGMDFGKMFGERYTSHMVHKIIDSLIAECNKRFEFGFYDEKKIANKRLFV